MDSMEKAKEFGRYLRSLRKEANLTLKSLSEATSITIGHLSNIENGRRGIPSPDILRKLAPPLGVAHSDLMVQAGHIEKPEIIDELIKIKNNEDFTEEYNVSHDLKLVLSILSDGEKFVDINEMDIVHDLARSRFGEDFILTPSSLIELVFSAYLSKEEPGERSEKDAYVFELLGFMADLALFFNKENGNSLEFMDIFNSENIITYNGYELTPEDRTQALDMLRVLFRKYEDE